MLQPQTLRWGCGSLSLGAFWHVLTSCERLFDANRAWWPPRFQSDLVQRVQGWFVPHSQWPVWIYLFGSRFSHCKTLISAAVIRRCCWIWIRPIRRWWLKYFDLQDWMVYWRYTENVSNLAVQMVPGLVFGHPGGSIFVNPQVQMASSIFLGPTVLVACASFVQRTAPSSLMS